MIRVANIIEEARMGGPQIRIANVAYALKDQVETTVVLPRQNSDCFRKKLDTLGVSYKIFRLSRITKEVTVALRYVFFSVFEVLNLARYFRKEKFDLVHVSGGSWQYKGLIAGKLAGTKSVWHLNDTSMPWVIRKLFSLFSSLPDAYIFASNRTQNYYLPMIPKGKKTFIIPAPVDTNYFRSRLTFEGDESLTNKWAGKIVIGTTANINPIKGLGMVINVAAKLNDQHEHLVFVIVGEIYSNQRLYYKKLLDLCRQLSVDNVVFAGGRDDVRPLLDRFDIYVCSSQSESSPISVWEAMSMEKPIVSVNVGDVAQYVHDEQNGYIVDVRDAATLADRVDVLISDGRKRKAFGCRSRAIAIEELDLARCALNHQEAYKSITQGSP